MLKKVLFDLQQDEDGYAPVGAEGVWAEHVVDQQFVVDNIPFFIREATLGDVIEVIKQDGVLRYSRTVKPSGNSLLRVVCYEGTDPQELRQELARLGCATEIDGVHHLIAVNVPPEVNVSLVLEFLRLGFEQDRWDYEEAILRQELS